MVRSTSGQECDDTRGSGGSVQQLFDDGVRELVNTNLLLGEQAQYLAAMVDLLLNRESALVHGYPVG